MHAASVATIVCAALLAVQVVSASPVYSRYRGVSIGDSVSVVVASLHLTPGDVAIVHARPAMIQQLTWRPNQFFASKAGPPEALAEMVLTFHLGRLARVVATYDRDRTEGLTNADLHDSFTTIYGTPMLVPTAGGVRSSSEPEIIGQWGDGETLVVLWREAYPRRFKVTVSSVAADRLLQGALASGARLEATEAPTRDMVRRLSEELTQRRLDEQSRLDNKSAFKP
jgi:hypothetical protein